jgi:hypothetical protein
MTLQHQRAIANCTRGVNGGIDIIPQVKEILAVDIAVVVARVPRIERSGIA